MFKNDEKNFLLICLIFIILCSIWLIIKIESEPQYNQQLYNEIYSEYEEIFSRNNISENRLLNSDADNEEIINKNESVSRNEYRIAGKIVIPKIEISYPILYETNDENLKIAPTKLFGPNVNEVGNLCIVGHNYKNSQFFSNLSQLENGDKIFLISNNNEEMTYFVYNKYETSENDMQCTSQDVGDNIEITLITCTTNKEKRLIVKARVDL